MKRLLVMFALSAALVLGVSAPAHASGNVDDFTFSSFDATYELDVDENGRSELIVVETLVAEFPQRDQNRGIRRELVDSYDGHPTDLEVLSVTDENGEPREFESESDNGFEVLTIAGDDFVRGQQTYVITYEQHNVTRYFADTDSDEFYWDTNGTGWAQPFDQVTATVSIAPDLAAKLTGRADAASGVEGADGPADITETDDGYTFTATDLGPRENLSFAIGFEEGTFVPRDSSFGAAPWPLLSLIGTLLTLAGVVGAFVVRRTRLRDAPSRGIIVPEYAPPKNASLLLSAVISGTTPKATTAQILALAVAGNLRVVEVTEGRKPAYRLDFVTEEGTDADSREFLHALFGAQLTPGENRDLKTSDTKAVSRISKLQSRVAAESIKDGYRRTLPAGAIAAVVAVALIGAVVSIIFAAVSLEGGYAGVAPAVFLGVSVLAAIAALVVIARRPFGAKGVELRDYLLGLKEYIALAEADRLRYLQSPDGAQRRPLDSGERAPDDAAEVVHLNERLLPYAVLFGHEKRWVQELGLQYEQLGTQPYWYYGTGPFNAALFASSIGTMATSVSSSYSSASGGSAGGASSGGGGGGGGGGGV